MDMTKFPIDFHTFHMFLDLSTGGTNGLASGQVIKRAGEREDWCSKGRMVSRDGVRTTEEPDGGRK